MHHNLYKPISRIVLYSTARANSLLFYKSPRSNLASMSIFCITFLQLPTHYRPTLSLRSFCIYLSQKKSWKVLCPLTSFCLRILVDLFLSPLSSHNFHQPAYILLDSFSILSSDFLFEAFLLLSHILWCSSFSSSDLLTWIDCDLFLA